VARVTAARVTGRVAAPALVGARRR
jgi:hypothetical protein